MLSKSRYLAGVQCEKRLYRDVREGASGAAGAGELDPVRVRGHEVGRVATERYPGGVRIAEDHLHHDAAVAATARAMADRSVPAIFEAAFTYRNIKVRIDILARRGRGSWRIEEVKSSTSVKDVHLVDLAVQLFVLEGCGVKVGAAGILHLNGRYVRRSRVVDLEKLFTFVDLKRKARELAPEVARNARRLLRVLEGAEPTTAAGAHCQAPYVCSYFDRCNPAPGRYAIQQLPRSQALAQKLAALGISDIRKIPDDVALTPVQARARASLIAGREQRSPDLGAALAEVELPLHFLDFETFAPAIPRYRHTGVYRPLPFQWSLHRLERDGTLHHAAFLHDEDSDPRRAFAESLLAAVGTSGSICVYTSFEAQRIAELAKALPAHRRALRAVARRLWDLHPILREHYYHPALGGSFSIKAIVPAVVPALSYDEVAISDGNQASFAYEAMIADRADLADRARTRDALLAYCQRDTLAMVEVRRVLLARCPGAGVASSFGREG